MPTPLFDCIQMPRVDNRMACAFGLIKSNRARLTLAAAYPNVMSSTTTTQPRRIRLPPDRPTPFLSPVGGDRAFDCLFVCSFVCDLGSLTTH